MKPRRIGFLFNHEAVHQVAHSAPTAFALSRDFPAIDVELLVSSPAQMAELEKIAAHFPGQRCRFTPIDCGPVAKVLDKLAGKFAPIKKVAVLRSNIDRFATLDALVTPEKTSAMIKHRFGLTDLTMIYARHGAGDRSLSFNADNALFDFLLLPGAKFRDRLAAAHLLEGRPYEIVGYPKFDLLPETAPKLFDNDRPTVLYNPHFDPRLSSWYKYGAAVLDYFYRSDKFNLIFAPHLMLFERLLHVSLEEFSMTIRKRLPKRYYDCPHMLIDTGSPASADMTYTMAADIYLGDVSSQVYEFIYRPRPCVFLNAHGAKWRDDPNYNHWRLGEVIDDPAMLDAALARAPAEHERQYAALQKEAFAYTFDLQETPSSVRAARAIVSFMERHRA